MSKRNSTESVEAAQCLDLDDVANVLTFLSWQVPIPDTMPCKESADQIETGRTLLLSHLAEHLRFAAYTLREELQDAYQAQRVSTANEAKEVNHG